jgi:hypothetical protein
MEKASRALEAKRKAIEREAELEAAEMAEEGEMDEEFTWQPPTVEDAAQERVSRPFTLSQCRRGRCY